MIIEPWRFCLPQEDSLADPHGWIVNNVQEPSSDEFLRVSFSKALHPFLVSCAPEPGRQSYGRLAGSVQFQCGVPARKR